MENIVKVSLELGYLTVPKNTLVDISKVKSLPKDKVLILTTGSQGEEMSALYRMAFSTHKQVEVGYGDRIINSASRHPRQRKQRQQPWSTSCSARAATCFTAAPGTCTSPAMPARRS